jgi:hypothetical protein
MRARFRRLQALAHKLGYDFQRSEPPLIDLLGNTPTHIGSRGHFRT